MTVPPQKYTDEHRKYMSKLLYEELTYKIIGCD
jgi:hypothetical protein